MKQIKQKKTGNSCQRILGMVGLMAITRISLASVPFPVAYSFFTSVKPVQSSPAIRAAHPVFKSIIPTLQKKTKVPILLPTYIPESDGEIPLYARLETINPAKYFILLDFDPKCKGGTACRLGSISGELITAKNRPLKGKIITLSKQRKGYFVDAVCGANCSDSTLSWQEKGYFYQVAIKAGDLSSLVKMANSTILIPLAK